MQGLQQRTFCQNRGRKHSRNEQVRVKAFMQPQLQASCHSRDVRSILSRVEQDKYCWFWFW